MGTNYYLRHKPCEHCGQSKPELHIGKSSAGCYFSLHVIPEMGINNLEDWVSRMMANDTMIFDEYGHQLSLQNMVDNITKREWPRTDSSFWDEKMYSDNHAEPGLNGLVRHKLEPGHCIKHGAGTWDCIVGDFS